MTKSVLLENFINERLLSKLQTDASITMNTAVLGHGGVIDKLRSYYVDDCPLICRRSTTTSVTHATKQKEKTTHRRKMVNEVRTIFPWTHRPVAIPDVYG